MTTLAIIFLVVTLGIGGIFGFISLIDWKVQATRKRLRREEQMRAEEAAAAKQAALEAERKPWREKCEAWLEAKKAADLAGDEPTSMYGQYGRMWHYPVETEAEYEMFIKAGYAPERQSVGYGLMQALQNVQHPYLYLQDNLSHGRPFRGYQHNCLYCHYQFSSSNPGLTHCLRCGNLA